MAAWTLSFVPLMTLTISRALSVGMPFCSVTFWRTVPPRAFSIVPKVSAFRGTLRFTRRPSSTSRTAFSLNSSEEVRRISSPWSVDLGAAALEVEAGRDLLHGLGDRVLDLLQVHAAHDVERALGHGGRFSGAG